MITQTSFVALILAVLPIYGAARDYAPDSGRFIQSDPIGLRGGLNTYSYVNSAPLTYGDSDGLQQTPSPGIKLLRILEGGPLRSLPGQYGYSPPISGDFLMLSAIARHNQSDCVQNYLRTNYPDWMSQTVVPQFSAISYIPGSGHTLDAYSSALTFGLGKALIATAPLAAGNVLQTIGAAGSGIGVAPIAGLGETLTMFGRGSTGLVTGIAVGGLFLGTTANVIAIGSCACSP